MELSDFESSPILCSTYREDSVGVSPTMSLYYTACESSCETSAFTAESANSKAAGDGAAGYFCPPAPSQHFNSQLPSSSADGVKSIELYQSSVITVDIQPLSETVALDQDDINNGSISANIINDVMILKNEHFISSEQFAEATSASDWDSLYSLGSGEPVGADISRYGRDSLFKAFDPITIRTEQDKSTASESANQLQTTTPQKDDQPKANSRYSGGKTYRKMSGPLVNIITPAKEVSTNFNETYVADPSSCSNEFLLDNSQELCEKDLSGLGIELKETGQKEPQQENIDVPSEADKLELEYALKAQSVQFETMLRAKDETIDKLKREIGETDNVAGHKRNQNADKVKKIQYSKDLATKHVEQIEMMRIKLAATKAEKDRLKAECDAASNDLRSSEDSFSLLHRNYEKTKGVMENFSLNKHVLDKRHEQMQRRLENKETKITAIKTKVSLTVETVNADYTATLKEVEADNVKLRAKIAMSELQQRQLEANLTQKSRESENIKELCNQLIKDKK